MLRLLPRLGFVFAAGLVAGCVGDDTNPFVAPIDASVGVDSSVPKGTLDAGSSTADGGLKSPVVAYVRFANWVSDAPVIDFCLAPHGTQAFEGPVVGWLAARVLDGGAGDASVASLSSATVTSYVTMPPDAYDVRVVVGGATGCDVGIAPGLGTIARLDTASFTTVGLLGNANAGDGGIGPSVVAFSDDERPGGSVALRFINAAPSVPQAAFGTGSLLKGYKGLFPSVAYGTTASANDAGADAGPAIDRNGYASVAPIVDGTVSAHTTGGAVDDAIASNVSAAAGAVVTVVLLASGAQGSVELLACVDNAGTLDVLGSCSVVSQPVDSPSRSARRSEPASQE